MYFANIVNGHCGDSICMQEVERVKLTPGQTSPVVPKRVANKLEVVCSGKMGSEDVPVQVRPMLYLI